MNVCWLTCLAYNGASVHSTVHRDECFLNKQEEEEESTHIFNDDGDDEGRWPGCLCFLLWMILGRVYDDVVVCFLFWTKVVSLW